MGDEKEKELQIIMPKKTKKIFISILMVVVLIIGIALGLFIGGGEKSEEKLEPTYDSNVIGNQVKELSELVTLEYRYRNAVKAEEPPKKLLGKINIPLTGNSMIVCYDGIVKIGTDLSETEVVANSASIDVKLAPCTIISHEIDDNSWKYLDISSNVFNPLTPEDGTELRKSQKEIIEKSIEQDEMIEDANAKAVEQVQSYLKTIYPEASINVSIKE